MGIDERRGQLCAQAICLKVVIFRFGSRGQVDIVRDQLTYMLTLPEVVCTSLSVHFVFISSLLIASPQTGTKLLEAGYDKPEDFDTHRINIFIEALFLKKQKI